MNNIDNEELLKDIKLYKDIKIVSESEGGQVILKALMTDILSCVTALGGYKVLTHPELISLSAKLTALLGIYKTLAGAQSNVDALQKILEESVKPQSE